MKFKKYLMEKSKYHEAWEKIEHYIIHMSEEEMPGVKTLEISYNNGVITVIVDRNDGITDKGYAADLSEKLWNRVQRHDDQILPPVIRVDVFNKPVDDETLIHPIKKWNEPVKESTFADHDKVKHATKGAFHPGQLTASNKKYLEYDDPFNVFQYERGDNIYFSFIEAYDDASKVEEADRVEYRYSPSNKSLYRNFRSSKPNGNYKIATVNSFEEAMKVAKLNLQKIKK